MLHKKIYVIGPESTGKSTLCAQLAEHYQTTWCPEFAREYLEKNGADYTYENLMEIAAGQLSLEHNIALQVNAAVYFVDTDMQVMQVWSEFVFDKSPHFILEQVAEQKADLYLLCNIDLPWVPDAFREYPLAGPRIRLFHMYKEILENQSRPFVVISGSDTTERLKQAIVAVDRLIKP